MLLDSQGKHRAFDSRRKHLVAVAFVVGLCAGIIVAERLYIRRRFRQQSSILHAGATQLPAHSAAAATAAATGAPPKAQDPNAQESLEELLRRVAPNKEVLVAVANQNLLGDGMLGTFGRGLLDAGVKNHVVFALDRPTLTWCQQHGLNGFLMSAVEKEAKSNPGDNHSVSAMKFGILKHFVKLGWAVLLSDVDIAVLQNPFKHLYRDSDVEGMSDGWDEATAYGAIESYQDKSMGWSQWAQLSKHFNMNSGLFYMRANERTLSMLTRLEARMLKGGYWDQTAYNEEMFFLSHGDYKSHQVSVRVMDIDMFMNSKRLFKDIRHRPTKPPKPVMVHINYHPDKHPRMKAVFEYYNKGIQNALDPFPGGSEPGS